MYQAGDLVVYAQNGVCRLTEVCPSPFDKSDDQLYYILCPELNMDHSTLYVPAALGDQRIRPLMTKEAAASLLDRVDEIPPLEVEIEKQRKDLYRRTITEAVPDGYIAVLKTVAIRRVEAQNAKRQLAGADTEFEQKAKMHLCLELSIVLERPLAEMIEAVMGKIAPPVFAESE